MDGIIENFGTAYARILKDTPDLAQSPRWSLADTLRADSLTVLVETEIQIYWRLG